MTIRTPDSQSSGPCLPLTASPMIRASSFTSQAKPQNGGRGRRRASIAALSPGALGHVTSLCPAPVAQEIGVGSMEATGLPWVNKASHNSPSSKGPGRNLMSSGGIDFNNSASPRFDQVTIYLTVVWMRLDRNVWAFHFPNELTTFLLSSTTSK